MRPRSTPNPNETVCCAVICLSCVLFCCCCCIGCVDAVWYAAAYASTRPNRSIAASRSGQHKSADRHCAITTYTSTCGDGGDGDDGGGRPESRDLRGRVLRCVAIENGALTQIRSDRDVDLCLFLSARACECVCVCHPSSQYIGTGCSASHHHLSGPVGRSTGSGFRSARARVN